jgi:hypothetical protein
LEVLGFVDRGGKYGESLSAVIDQLDGREGSVVGEEVPAADIRQPARQLLQVLLALLELGEGELPGPRLLVDLGEESVGAFGELVVLTATVGPELPDDGRIDLRPRLGHGQDESAAAVLADHLQ